MDNQIVATFYINHRAYDIYGCWDKDTPQHKFDFYDIYDEEGFCINEGEPFYSFPTYHILKDFIDTVTV